MFIRRNAYLELLNWKAQKAQKAQKARKPLILRGARQVGKTTLVADFADTYKHYISLNLERPDDLLYFKKFDNAKTIVNALFTTYNIPADAQSDTLLFIDEIQESPAAIALLRYFYEDVPALHVIAAGSLLEHVMDKVTSFPVGRVTYLHLYPLNFEEFLVAKGHQIALDALRQIPVVEYAQPVLMDLFHEYAIIGGMPEVVTTYLAADSLSDLSGVYESIWTTYKDDVEKYANNSTNAKVIRHIMQVAHLYVDQRVKFQNFGNSNYRSREVGEALRNLHDARIIQLVYPATNTAPPILQDLKKSPRLQFLDTGLVNHELGIQVDLLALDDFNPAYKGAIIPHLITQELMSVNIHRYKQTHFWVREKAQSTAEVDLIWQHKDMIIPIEVKSGKEGSLKSLHQFMEATDHPYAIRMYAGEYKVEEHSTPNQKKPYFLMNLPYYLGTQLPKYISYFVDNYAL